MRSKLVHEISGLRTFVVVMKAGDEAMRCLLEFATAQNISVAQITAVGAFQSAELAFFDWERKDYVPIPISEQVEVASAGRQCGARTGRQAHDPCAYGPRP